MSIEKKVFKGITWLAGFKFISQIFSWGITILVARILVPDDYGLMSMATIITGYAVVFSNLGLGAAIIQRTKPTRGELSSVFWFAMVISIFFAASCFPISYLTANIMHDDRVIPLTQVVSVLFILSGLEIVPSTLLRKSLRFKEIGLIGMISVIVSCCCMITMAYAGWGVWTLVYGVITNKSMRLMLVYIVTKWYPGIHFSYKEAKPYLKFGIILSISSSFRYINENSDKYFAGRTWNANTLGYYSFALQLAVIPTDKIVSLIRQVAFPAFTILKGDKERFNKFYLNITKATATIVFPLYVGGYLVGGDLVKLLLSEKWLPIIFLFKYLCLAQIMVALLSISNPVHTAQGRPLWTLYFNSVRVALMPVSFYFAVQYGMNAILLPWFTIYLLISLVWIIITLNKIGINVFTYLRNLLSPFIAVLLLSASIILYEYAVKYFSFQIDKVVFMLFPKIIIGAIFYLGYIWLFDRNLFISIQKLRKS